MRRAIRSTVVALTLILAATDPLTVVAQEANDKYTCEQGPIVKTIGGSEWNVYSCTDELTLMFLAVEGSPAHPFIFILSPEGEGYALYGQGTGDRAATQAARDEIATFTAETARALIEETRLAD